MTQKQWDEIQAERRQLWCEALLVAMHNFDQSIAPATPEQAADGVLAAYDRKFAIMPPAERPRKSRMFKPMPFSQDDTKR